MKGISENNRKYFLFLFLPYSCLPVAESPLQVLPSAPLLLVPLILWKERVSPYTG